MEYKNVIVSAVEDCDENTGGYYCVVETRDGAEIDNFCIHREDLSHNPDVDFWLRNYLDSAYKWYVEGGLVPPFFALRPASPDEAGLFYAQTPEEDEALGAIGHVRMDFGHGGKEFWHTWHPRGPEELNSPEFKAELDEVVGQLRESVLRDLSSMHSYCNHHGGEIEGGACTQNYGYVVETEKYRYLLRCNPIEGDYQAYLSCFDKQAQKMSIIGRITFANGEQIEYTDPAEYLKAIREELPCHATSGFRFKTLTSDPEIRKAADDMLYDLYGEENPRKLEDYQEQPDTGMTMGGM